MSEDKEDSDLQGTVDEEKTRLVLELSKDSLIRFKLKASEDRISMSDFLRSAIERYLQEDERVEFLVDESTLVGSWKSWEEYREKQKEKDKEIIEEFTREEMDDIYKLIEDED